MQSEIDAFDHNRTWTLVPPPNGCQPVGCKLVFLLKLQLNGELNRHKVRLVVKRFTQTFGFDYFDTFSPVVKPSTVRLILSLVVTFSWPIKQLDVNNEFLHSDLHDEVFMEQLLGFVDETYLRYICRLHKSIYGLKQSPRARFLKLSSSLLILGFLASKTDSSHVLHLVIH